MPPDEAGPAHVDICATLGCKPKAWVHLLQLAPLGAIFLVILTEGLALLTLEQVQDSPYTACMTRVTRSSLFQSQ